MRNNESWRTSSEEQRRPFYPAVQPIHPSPVFSHAQRHARYPLILPLNPPSAAVAIRPQQLHSAPFITPPSWASSYRPSQLPDRDPFRPSVAATVRPQLSSSAPLPPESSIYSQRLDRDTFRSPPGGAVRQQQLPSSPFLPSYAATSPYRPAQRSDRDTFQPSTAATPTRSSPSLPQTSPYTPRPDKSTSDPFLSYRHLTEGRDTPVSQSSFDRSNFSTPSIKQRPSTDHPHDPIQPSQQQRPAAPLQPPSSSTILQRRSADHPQSSTQQKRLASLEPSAQRQAYRHPEKDRDISINHSSSFNPSSNPPTLSTIIHQRRSADHQPHGPSLPFQQQQRPPALLEPPPSKQQRLAAPTRSQQKESWLKAAPPKPIEVTLYATTSSKECVIQWYKPELLPQHGKVYTIKAWENEKLIDEIEIDRSTCKYTLKTNPGEKYTVEYLAKNGNVVAKGKIEFRATFSRSEMNQLLQKAIECASSSRPAMHPFRVLYRCKPQCYWDDIQQRTNNMMIKYIKDENGQAANPINGSVFGLFFSARLLPNGRLPVLSPFGNIRMMLPADNLLNPKRANMYFCDFYCNKLTHYVTIVVCVKGTRSDDYCKHKLLLLPSNNPFISIIPGEHGNEFYVNKNVWVEIYWTENIPICWGKFDRINATGFGTSKLGGLRHNKRCAVCNLYPIGGNKKVVQTNEETLNDDEEEVNEAVAKQSLDKMVASMNGCQLPKRDCEDIVFLLNDLVDRVACDTDMKHTDGKHGSINVGKKQQPASSGYRKKKGGIASSFRNLRGAVTKRINRVQSTVVKKKNQLKKKFYK